LVQDTFIRTIINTDISKTILFTWFSLVVGFAFSAP